AINGYTVGSTVHYINNLAKPIFEQGTVLTNKQITSVNSAGNYSSVIVKTSDGSEYRGKFFILAVEPEQVESGRIQGNLMNQLNDTEVFKSVYCVTVVTVTATLDFAFWKTLVPEPEGNITQWV